MSDAPPPDPPLPKRRAQSGNRPSENPDVPPAAASLRVNAGFTDNCLQGIIVMFCAPVGVVVGLFALGRMGGLVFGLIGGLVAGLIVGSVVNSIRRAALAKAAKREQNGPA